MLVLVVVVVMVQEAHPLPEEGAAEGAACQGSSRMEAAATTSHLPSKVHEAGHPHVQLARERHLAITATTTCRRCTPDTPTHYLQGNEGHIISGSW